VRLHWRNLKHFLSLKTSATAAKTVNSLAPLAEVDFILSCRVAQGARPGARPVTMQQTMIM
jgi:hypothetical protein